MVDNKNIFFLFGLAFTAFAFFLLKSLGLYPVVMADEYTYSKLSRLMDVKDSHIPGYLFLSIYQVSDVCGDAFLSCAKVLNSFFHVSALPFIYMIARRVTNSSVSLLLCVLVLLSPVSSYTAYFMPESFYFFSFWFFSWFLLSLDSDSKVLYWCVAALLFVVTSLIKPHSFFFLPAIFLYICFVFYIGGKLFSKYAVTTILVFFATVFLAKFGIGYLFAGSSGVTIFGKFYGSMAESSQFDVDKALALVKLISLSLFGHFLSLSYVYAVPFLLSVYIVWYGICHRKLGVSDRQISPYYSRLAFYSLLVILNLICVVAIFTASIANTSIYETPYRLHLRYYSFVLPMLFIVAAGFFVISGAMKSIVYRLVFAGIFLAGFVVAVVSRFHPYITSFVDNPEIGGIIFSRKAILFNIFSFVVCIGFIVFIFKSAKSAAKYYVYVILPVFILSTLIGVAYQLRARMTPDVYDNAGLYVKNYFGSDSVSKLLLVGSEPGALFRTLYHIDTPEAEGNMLRFLAAGQSFDLHTVPDDKEWLLVVGNHEVADSEFRTVRMDGFTLVNVSKKKHIDFSKSNLSFTLNSIHGLSSAEPWGRWSDADRVELVFDEPLSKNINVTLKANAFGPNLNSNFEMIIGDEVVPFSITNNGQVVSLSFQNEGRADMLRINIPSPTSPKELGVSGDDRRLGIGLIEMIINKNN